MFSPRTLWALPAILVCTSCSRPPETPEGLDQSLRYLFQAFYGSDTEVAAGLTGLQDWYEDEGKQLLGKSANLDNIGSFELDELRDEDVEAFSPRPPGDPRDASGVIAVAELPCRWKQAEDLLVRPDQDEVFTDFDYYNRTYVNSRRSYDDARKDDAFPTQRIPLDPEDLNDVSEVLLMTENATSGTEMGVTIEFDLNMHARHGQFEVLGEQARASLFVTWMPDRAEAEGGVNTMEQSYTFEVDLERNGETLWVYGSWAEVRTAVFDSDSTTLLAVSANKAQGTAKRMADICDGKIELD